MLYSAYHLSSCSLVRSKCQKLSGIFYDFLLLQAHNVCPSSADKPSSNPNGADNPDPHLPKTLLVPKTTLSAGTFSTNPSSEDARSSVSASMTQSYTTMKWKRSITSRLMRSASNSACNVSGCIQRLKITATTLYHNAVYILADVVCPNLTVGENMNKPSDNGLEGWGRAMVFTCANGYSLSDNAVKNSRTCQKNGTWSGTPPVCLSEF